MSQKHFIDFVDSEVQRPKRANKCPLILFLGFLENIFNGEGEITSQATQADTGLYGTYF